MTEMAGSRLVLNYRNQVFIVKLVLSYNAVSKVNIFNPNAEVQVQKMNE